MTLFDAYVAVDWSANANRKRGANSIWLAICDTHGMLDIENPATRHEAVGRIKMLLNTATEEGRRLLCGFDFAFGYPEGTAQMLTNQSSWAAVWARIAEVIEDGADNKNNRFEAAAKLNEGFKGDGPFWGNGLKREIPKLPKKRPRFVWGVNLLPRFRYAECLVPRAQEVWKLNGNGSVGGQALTGIAALEKLRRHRTDV